MREDHWFERGERGAYRPEHAEVDRLVARAVRRWGVALSAALLGVAAHYAAGEPPPPGAADAAGLALLVTLLLAWPRAELLAGLTAAGIALSARNTSLQGPALFSGVWLLLGLLAWRSARRCRRLQREHAVQPLDAGAAWVAGAASALAVVGLVLHVAGVELRGGALEGAVWGGALGLGTGLGGASRDHPGRRAAVAAAVAGGVVLGLIALWVALAYTA